MKKTYTSFTFPLNDFPFCSYRLLYSGPPLNKAVGPLPVVSETLSISSSCLETSSLRCRLGFSEKKSYTVLDQVNRKEVSVMCVFFLFYFFTKLCFIESAHTFLVEKTPKAVASSLTPYNLIVTVLVYCYSIANTVKYICKIFGFLFHPNILKILLLTQKFNEFVIKIVGLNLKFEKKKKAKWTYFRFCAFTL